MAPDHPDRYRDDLLVAVAVAAFSSHDEHAEPALARRAWQLAQSRLAGSEVEPDGAIDELDIGNDATRDC